MKFLNRPPFHLSLVDVIVLGTLAVTVIALAALRAWSLYA